MILGLDWSPLLCFGGLCSFGQVGQAPGVLGSCVFAVLHDCIGGVARRWVQGHFPLGGIFRAERHFLLFKDQLAESGRQKTKENIIPAENSVWWRTTLGGLGWWLPSLLGFFALGLDISEAIYPVGVGDGSFFSFFFILGLFGLGFACLLTGASL